MKKVAVEVELLEVGDYALSPAGVVRVVADEEWKESYREVRCEYLESTSEHQPGQIDFIDRECLLFEWGTKEADLAKYKM